MRGFALKIEDGVLLTKGFRVDNAKVRFQTEWSCEMREDSYGSKDVWVVAVKSFVKGVVNPILIDANFVEPLEIPWQNIVSGLIVIEDQGSSNTYVSDYTEVKWADPTTFYGLRIQPVSAQEMMSQL